MSHDMQTLDPTDFLYIQKITLTQSHGFEIIDSMDNTKGVKNVKTYSPGA